MSFVPAVIVRLKEDYGCRKLVTLSMTGSPRSPKAWRWWSRTASGSTSVPTAAAPTDGAHVPRPVSPEAGRFHFGLPATFHTMGVRPPDRIRQLRRPLSARGARLCISRLEPAFWCESLVRSALHRNQRPSTPGCESLVRRCESLVREMLLSFYISKFYARADI